MAYQIQKLEPQNYDILNQIEDMRKNPKRSKKFYKELVSGNRIIFIYLENEKCLGEGAIVFHTDDPDYTIKNKRIYISRMIVKQEYRNRGIGDAMLHFLIDYAKNAGYQEISIGVDIGNIGARWLYEKNGFTNIIFVGEDKNGKYVKLLKKI